MPFVLFFTSFLLTFFWCQWLARGRLRRRFLDAPNERSSHVVAVPRGGGAFFALTIVIGTILGGSASIWFVLAYLITAGVGIWDDLKPLPAKTRFHFQFLAALCLTFHFYLTLPTAIQAHPVFSILFWLASVFLILSFVNFINFADGINGYVSLSALLGIVVFLMISHLKPNLTFIYNSHVLLAPALCLFSGALMAFIYQNLIRKKVFMGDGGSTVIGLFFATLGLLFFGEMVQSNADGLFSYILDYLTCWLLIMSLLSCVFFDCAAMVVAKLFAGAKLSQAHNNHFYQQLNRDYFKSHAKTTLALCTMQSLFAIWVFYDFSISSRMSFFIRTTMFLIVYALTLTFYHLRTIRKFKVI